MICPRCGEPVRLEDKCCMRCHEKLQLSYSPTRTTFPLKVGLRYKVLKWLLYSSLALLTGAIIIMLLIYIF